MSDTKPPAHRPFTPEVIDDYLITRTIHFKAPVRRVWRAISDTRELARWFPTASAEWDLVPGGTGVFTWNGYGDFPIRVEAVEEPAYLAWTWGHEATSPAVTLVEWRLVEKDGGTELTVTESGIRTQAHFAENTQGWDEELSELVALLES